jgi:hypothetical protein
MNASILLNSPRTVDLDGHRYLFGADLASSIESIVLPVGTECRIRISWEIGDPIVVAEFSIPQKKESPHSGR